MPRTIPLNPENKAIHAQIGKAIEAFAMVEGAQAMLIQKLLNIDLQSAYAIFFAVQNVPSRNEMLTTLIRVRHGGKYDSYWRSCRVFLQKLAEFRNALAHWHPVVSVFTDKEMNERRFEYEIMDIRPSKSTAAIGVDGISPFIEDCRII